VDTARYGAKSHNVVNVAEKFDYGSGFDCRLSGRISAGDACGIHLG
jgi:hypothetical protein